MKENDTLLEAVQILITMVARLADLEDVAADHDERLERIEKVMD